MHQVFSSSSPRSIRRRNRKAAARRFVVISEPNVIERLEARQMLSTVSAAAFDLKSQPIFHATNDNYADLKSGPFAIAGGDLANLYIDYRRAAKSGHDFALSAEEKTLQMPDIDHVFVDIGTRVDFDTFAKRMKSAGMIVNTADSSLGVLEGYVPISQLLTLATRSDVALLRPIFRPVTGEGIAVNQADQALNTVGVRNTYGLNGAGVTVGVLSDSYNQLSSGFGGGGGSGGSGGGTNSSVITGDLPSNVNVVNDYNDAFHTATDEGRAMLELVHDIVPASSLAFSTGEGGQLTFAQHVRALKNAGADVISDDLTYFDEPFFGPGVIDNAIGDVVAGGAAYTSDASNYADGGFGQSAQYATVGNKRYIDFDPSSKVATRMLVKIATGGSMVLQWDNPYNGVTGNVTADMDIYFYLPGTNTLVASGIDYNLATGVPVENLFLPSGNYDVEIQLTNVVGTNPPPTTYRLSGDAGISYTKYETVRSNSVGHNAGENTIDTAAVPWYAAPPVASASAVIPTESFSAEGPVTHLFDAAGNRLAKPLNLQKPDISGVDGVNISFALDGATDDSHDTDSNPQFYGTSAAAPNVAAGIAQIKQVAPGVSQADILAALKATARPVNGTPAGTWDKRGGYGLVDFTAALPKAISTFRASIVSVSPDPRPNGVNSLTIKFNQRTTGFDITDLSLTNSGGADLLTGAQTLTTSDNITFTLRNLSTITGSDGVYTLTLTAAGSGIRNLVGTALKKDATETFSVFTPGAPPARPTNFAAEAVGSTAINLTWNDRSSNESGFQILKSLDPTFTNDPVSIKVGPNVTSYLDTDLKASNIYYYRIRALNPLNGNSSYTTPVNALTAVTGDVVIDSDSKYAHASSGFTTASAGTGYLGEDYLTTTGGSDASVKYIPTLSGSGQYYIYARFPGGSGNAKNVPFDIFYGAKAALKATVLVNEQKGGHGYVLIGGPYQMDAGSGAAVRIRAAGTSGNVIADAIRFLPAGPLTPSALGSFNSSANPFSGNPIQNGTKPVNDDLI